MADKIKLRRGLSANRVSQLPEAGEPLFDTDTRKLYIGDGITPGGLPITGGSSTSYINELLDVSTDSIQDGQVLVWVEAESKFMPSSSVGSDFSGSYNDLADLPTLVDVLNDLTNVNTFGATDGQVLTYRSDTDDWVPLDTNISSVSTFYKYYTTDTETVACTEYEGTLNLVSGNNISIVGDAATEAITISYTGAENLASLNDVAFSTISTGDVVSYNGTSWINTTLSYNSLTDLPTVPSSIGDLSDITLNTLATGQALVYNGSEFTNIAIDYSTITNTPTIPSSLNDLSDVVISSSQSGQTLVFNGTSYVNTSVDYTTLSNLPTIPTTLSELTNDANYSTVTTLVGLTDTTIASPTNGNVLRHDGTDWKNAVLSYSDLSNKPTFGTAAYENTSSFATAAQGAKADTALQDLTTTSILELSDVPSSWGTSGQVLAVNGTGNGFTFTTVSTSGGTQNIFATVESDNGSTTADSTTDTLTISGGDGISTSITGDVLTITNTDQQRKTASVSASTTAVIQSYASTNESAWVDYVYKTASSGVKMGTLFIATDGTSTSITDTGTGVGTFDISFTAAINTGNVELSYTESNGDTGTIVWTMKLLNI